MALPDFNEYGIRLTVTAAFQSTATGTAQNPNIQIWRTLASTSSAVAPSTTWSQIANLPSLAAQDVNYTDKLPNDSTRRFYRVRHTKVGWAPSTYYQDILSAIPVQLPSVE